MSLFWVIVIIVIGIMCRAATDSMKNSAGKKNEETPQGTPQQTYNYGAQNNIPGATKNPNASTDAWGRRVVTDADREKLEQFRARKAATSAPAAKRNPAANTAGTVKTTTVKSTTENGEKKTSTVEQLAKKAAANRNTTIVDRAKSNTDKLKNDETLEELEKEHHHSEADPQIHDAHSRNCQTLKKGDGTAIAEETENMLGTTEDLMVKGYSGNLTFDRDFVSEAMDMLTAVSQINDSLPKPAEE